MDATGYETNDSREQMAELVKLCEYFSQHPPIHDTVVDSNIDKNDVFTVDCTQSHATFDNS